MNIHPSDVFFRDSAKTAVRGATVLTVGLRFGRSALWLLNIIYLGSDHFRDLPIIHTYVSQWGNTRILITEASFTENKSPAAIIFFCPKN